jgi:tetratricopeptide (TPR) repeat protein
MRPAIPALLAALLLASPAHAVDPGGGDGPIVTLGPVRAAIEAEDWAGALALLRPILAAAPNDADALNLAGYASRKAGDLDAAASHYAAALRADPDHLGALEYQGELFLERGDRAAAEANLARLVALCGACEEQADLAAALARAGR